MNKLGNMDASVTAPKLRTDSMGLQPPNWNLTAPYPVSLAEWHWKWLELQTRSYILLPLKYTWLGGKKKKRGGKEDAYCDCALQNAAGIYWHALIYESFSAVWYYTHLELLYSIYFYCMSETQNRANTIKTTLHLSSEVWLLIKNRTITSSSLHNCNCKISNYYHESTKKKNSKYIMEKL